MEANMNLKKLDTIKTPESWKKELLEQSIETESVNFKIKFTSLRKMKWAMDGRARRGIPETRSGSAP